MSRELVTNARRIVIKIGTRVLTENDNTLSYSTLRPIVQQVSSLVKGQRDFIIVTSGAIALGLNRAGLQKRPRDLRLLQAAAAMGQSRLMHAYEDEFSCCSHETAQILLTYEDIQNRKRYINIRNTIFSLWSFGVIPIVNENDSVSFSEIRFGDNDLLAAHLSSMMDADILIILTDTEGVYTADPRVDPQAKVIYEIKSISSRVKGLAGPRG
ncbi:MAG: glutamate 5-kinase, partial [Spirochaetota bacterium]